MRTVPPLSKRSAVSLSQAVVDFSETLVFISDMRNSSLSLDNKGSVLGDPLRVAVAVELSASDKPDDGHPRALA